IFSCFVRQGCSETARSTSYLPGIRTRRPVISKPPRGRYRVPDDGGAPRPALVQWAGAISSGKTLGTQTGIETNADVLVGTGCSFRHPAAEGRLWGPASGAALWPSTVDLGVSGALCRILARARQRVLGRHLGGDCLPAASRRLAAQGLVPPDR